VESPRKPGPKEVGEKAKLLMVRKITITGTRLTRNSLF
jgi:hypothetical protein